MVAASFSPKTMSPTSSSAGRELLLELQRSSKKQQHGNVGNFGGTSNNINPTNNGHDVLPPYNTKLVRTCLKDLQNSVRALQEEVQASMMDFQDSQNVGESENTAASSATGATPDFSARPSILLHNAMIHRNKRCLLAYHFQRLERIKHLPINSSALLSQEQQKDDRTRTTSTNASNSNPNQQGNTHLHPTEQLFQQEYQDLRQRYAQTVFDLNVAPPVAHRIQVRVGRGSAGDAVTRGTSSVFDNSRNRNSNTDDTRNDENERNNNEEGQPRHHHNKVVMLESGTSITLTPGSIFYLPRSDVIEFLNDGTMECLVDDEEGDDGC